MLRVVIVSVGAFADDGGERLGQPWAELFIVGDVEAGVEGLVRQSAVGVAGAGVGVVRVGEQPQRVVQECPATGVVCVALGKALVHVREACPDAVLVSLQCREVDGVGEVRGEQLVTLGLQLGPVCHEVGYFLVAACHALIERRIHLRGEVAVGVVADRDRGVGVGDEAFGDRDGYRTPRAGRLLGGATGADEVGVGRAARVGGEVEQHPRPAGTAVQQPFQVVGVLDMPGHLRRPRFQERLHLVEQSWFHDGVVRAGIQGALVADHSRVVRVREELVERVLPQRLRGALRCRDCDEAARGEVAKQPGHRGLALGVLLERPPDQRCTLGIDLDRPDFAAVLVGLADVEVSDGGAHRGAALGDLLRQALGHFGGEVPGVELGDGGHDAVYEHPRGCLVDGLGGRHECDPGGEKRLMDRDVVGAVAGEPVELVHDAERDAGRGDERQHLLQPITIRRTC